MKRASITITTKRGTNYDANHITIEKLFDGKQMISQISFLCSGTRTTLLPEEIKEIIFAKESATWCSECDGSINNIS